MTDKPAKAILTLAVLAAMAATVALGADDKDKKKPRKKKKHHPTWVDVKDVPADYHVQGEYVGTAGEKKLGVQVIALGDGHFQAVFYPGGLPGAGSEGKTKVCLDGKTKDGKTVFEPSKAGKKYMGGSAEQFSALRNPPAEQQDWQAVIADGKLTGKTADGSRIAAERTVRKSPTLGMKPPAGAVVLFDGSGSDGWKGGRVDKRGLLAAGTRTEKTFGSFRLHLEFMTPFKPTARGQGRGNSGLYLQHRYEIQILDSFGLEGFDNECGGIYKKGRPKVNMCLPPLTWQTYDVEFTAPVFKDGKKVKNARATVKHNGVVIHDDLEIDGKTGGSRGNEGEPGPIYLQGHGNPVFFRNIWIVPKK